MISVRRILYPTDFESCSLPAAKFAAELASRFDAELHLLYVLEDAIGKLPTSPDIIPPPGEQLDDMGPSTLLEIGSLLNLKFDEEQRLVRATRQGFPDREIVAYAKEFEMDLIVIGTHGRKGIARLLMGSTAENIIRSAPAPVLTVRPQDAPATDGN